MSEPAQIPMITQSSEVSNSSLPKPAWKWTTGQLAVKAALTFYRELASTVRAANSDIAISYDDSDSDSDEAKLPRVFKTTRVLHATSSANSGTALTPTEPPTMPEKDADTEATQTEGHLTTAGFLAHVLLPWKTGQNQTIERDPTVIRKQLLEWTNDAQDFLKSHQRAFQQSQGTESSPQDVKDCFRFVSEMNTIVRPDDPDFWDDVRASAALIKDWSGRSRVDNALGVFVSASLSLSYFSFAEAWEGAPVVFEVLHSLHDWYFSEKELDPSKEGDVIQSLKRLQEHENTLRSRLRSARSGDDSKPNRQERRRIAKSQRT